MNAPAQFRPEITDEHLRLLRKGAATFIGFICCPYEAKGRMHYVYKDLVKKGLVVMLEGGRPTITEAGRDYVARVAA